MPNGHFCLIGFFFFLNEVYVTDYPCGILTEGKKNPQCHVLIKINRLILLGT